MEQHKIKQQQEDRLNEFIIKQKESEIRMLKQTTKIKVEQLERNLKYLKGINKEKGIKEKENK